MPKQPKYYIIDASVLPEIYSKVAEAQRLLATGEVMTVNDACKRLGISRSAFYKYRDTVLPFQSIVNGRILTFQMMLHDEPGVLSAVLAVYANRKANVMTINSIIPTNGHALATISAELTDLTVSLEDLLEELRNTNGVIKTEVLAG